MLYANYDFTCTDPEGRGGGGTGVLRTPLENYKNIGFPSNTGPDPLKITNLHVPIQHSMFGHHRTPPPGKLQNYRIP